MNLESYVLYKVTIIPTGNYLVVMCGIGAKGGQSFGIPLIFKRQICP